MAEQLSFRLEPDLPRLPALEPMWPMEGAQPFDSARFLFEPSWHGRRALAFVGPARAPGGGEVRLVAGDGEELSSRLPELRGLGVRIAARSAVLDGELVVVDAAGRPDPVALEARLAGRRGRPVAYLVFDLLDVDGRPLLRLPLRKRRAELRRVLRPGDEVVVVPAISAEGRALHAAVVAQGIPGVLARDAASPYLPGVRSRLWRSIDARPDLVDVVAAPEDTPRDETGDGTGDESGTAPVLALFRRLPLEEEGDAAVDPR